MGIIQWDICSDVSSNLLIYLTRCDSSTQLHKIPGKNNFGFANGDDFVECLLTLILSKGRLISVIGWRLPSPSSLVQWTAANRKVRPSTIVICLPSQSLLLYLDLWVLEVLSVTCRPLYTCWFIQGHYVITQIHYFRTSAETSHANPQWK